MVTRTDALRDRAFQQLCERFRALETRKKTEEASASFEQAQLIRDARGRLRVPVAEISKALDLSAQSINDYRNVAERIDKELFRALIEERRSNGYALFPWSIIVQVGRLEDKSDREELIDKIRRWAWRAREVQGYVSLARMDARATTGGKSAERGSAERNTFVPRLVRASNRDARVDEEGHRYARGVASHGPSELEALVEDAPDRSDHPARFLTASADGARRIIEGLARDAAWAQVPAQELKEANDALARWAEAVTHMQSMIRGLVAEAERQPSKPHKPSHAGNGDGRPDPGAM